MTDKERLEEIKEAIAHQLGLTNDWMDGTYLYYLTRSKSAFSVGTMTLDDFTEIDEELLEEIFNAIKPYFIELAERVEELEEERDEWKNTAQSYYMTNQELREQNQRYKRGLEEISNADWNSEGLDAERELDKVTDVAFKALECDDD